MDCSTIKFIHRLCAGLSLVGFFVRGTALLAGARWVRSRPAKTLPHVVDALLPSALSLAWMFGSTPANAPWLAAKVIALAVCIGPGVVALRPCVRTPVRADAWMTALATAAWIVAAAIIKNPSGFLAWRGVHRSAPRAARMA